VPGGEVRRRLRKLASVTAHAMILPWGSAWLALEQHDQDATPSAEHVG
jgi:hypothetical protein